ncbi:phosphatidylinositol N-acetylglucosaminyltransferase subunit C [Panaeolus papilionaceus]|nr:phosphatidylinositol N-acetylglucosaminyltransferase subunit C [Panaeolus papilionaceus]
MCPNEEDEHEWEKVLWKRHAYPDNYVPPRQFLASLQRNPNLRRYSYWPLVVLSCSITQHLANIFIFLSVFVRLKEESLDPRSLVCISTLLFCIGYTAWVVLNANEASGKTAVNHLKTFKSSIMMFLTLMSLSPVLRTLTAATSSDSIWALSAVLFLLSALLADYRAIKPQNSHNEGLSSVLSMNAAVSASVVLGSRLSTDASVFALMLFSILCFALYPLLRYRLQSTPASVWLSITAGLWISAVWLVASLSRIVMWLYGFILFFVTLIAPAILIWAQRYKNIIRGPWDVAIPKVN